MRGFASLICLVTVLWPNLGICFDPNLTSSSLPFTLLNKKKILQKSPNCSSLNLGCGRSRLQPGEIGSYVKPWEGFPDGSVVKNLLGMHKTKEMQVDSWVGKLPWRRKWQPTPVLVLENPTGRRARWATVHGAGESLEQLSTGTWSHMDHLEGKGILAIKAQVSAGWGGIFSTWRETEKKNVRIEKNLEPIKSSGPQSLS